MSASLFLLAFCLLGQALTRSALQRSWLFSQVTDLSIGAQRLFTAHTERFPVNCQSVMYHHVTRQCTPAGWLNGIEAGPSADEGQLFTKAWCDTSDGFAQYTYGTAVACLLHTNVTDTFSKARIICQSYDSHVITLKSSDELHLPALITDADVFLGLTDELEENHFVWDDSHEELIVPFWGSGEPNGRETESCVALGSDLYAFDLPCNWSREILCEREMI